ncbi:cupin domain-containing protein [Thalassovita sp.]|uniref:cupin domain-containing protein n=1 Tax=Thalassovita sp. TaxID=1979401 RepID=UPI0029DE66A2|nr:cupin domain-containing protein [Thalassovita sp.]
MNIGERLKQIRAEKGLSQRELAARAGMTSGAISLIEQDKTSPSVSSLKRILDGIPVSLSAFFSSVEDELTPKYFYAPGEFTELSPQDLGMTSGRAQRLSLKQLGDASRHNLQVLYETYPPGSDTGEEMLSHESEEAGIVVSGEVEVTVDGQARVLRAGDGYLFDSRLPHRFRNIGTADCVVISACTPPTF